ncbi:hypothetical protein CLV68_3072 [Actinokineospora cianjurensis]|uniref:Uncharacterized protein n=1 Tax=Actinokineospora cianjurensis TaxID=585224 RepID=A0A421B2I6_9PSEU|nr:hypothetical protein CLV68_3072 [Actinokineospora cianjurensis]
MAGVVRLIAAGGRCWICGMTSVSGEKLPGRRHKIRLLCRRHDELVFGTPPQPDPAGGEQQPDHG